MKSFSAKTLAIVIAFLAILGVATASKDEEQRKNFLRQVSSGFTTNCKTDDQCPQLRCLPWGHTCPVMVCYKNACIDQTLVPKDIIIPEDNIEEDDGEDEELIEEEEEEGITPVDMSCTTTDDCPVLRCLVAPCDEYVCLRSTCVLVESSEKEEKKPKEEDNNGRETCGFNTCPKGLVCCNPSCGICTEEGGFCIQQACDPSELLLGKPKPKDRTGDNDEEEEEEQDDGLKCASTKDCPVMACFSQPCDQFECVDSKCVIIPGEDEVDERDGDDEKEEKEDVLDIKCTTDLQCPQLRCMPGPSCPTYKCLANQCVATYPHTEAPVKEKEVVPEVDEEKEDLPILVEDPTPIPDILIVEDELTLVPEIIEDPAPTGSACKSDLDCPVFRCMEGFPCPVYSCIDNICVEALLEPAETTTP